MRILVQRQRGYARYQDMTSTGSIKGEQFLSKAKNVEDVITLLQSGLCSDGIYRVIFFDGKEHHTQQLRFRRFKVYQEFNGQDASRCQIMFELES